MLPVLAGCAIAAGTMILVMVLISLQRRRRLIRLRLAAGQQFLLEDEITHCCNQLAQLDTGELEQSRETASQALAQIQIALVERQVHLMVGEELLQLLDRRVGRLNRLLTDGAVAESAVPEAEQRTPARSGRYGPGSSQPPARRSQLERMLRDRISQHRRTLGN